MIKKCSLAVIGKVSAPASRIQDYVVTEPVFAKAETAEEAIEKALHESKRREAEKEEATKAAEDAGLPDLKGTPRQIAWALQIRAAFAKKDPSSSKLKKATTAKYWIENRNSL